MRVSYLCQKARESKEGSASETRSGDPGVVAMSAHSQHAHLREAIHKTDVDTFLMLMLKIKNVPKKAAEREGQPSRTDEPFCMDGFEMKDKPNGGYGLDTTY